MDAIDAGYDEITHINWIMMQAMPDSVIKVSNGIMRFEGPGRFAKDVDLDGPAIKTIVDDDGREAHLQRSDDGRVRKPVRARRMATCRRPTRRSSARCRRPPSAASAPAASRCRRT